VIPWFETLKSILKSKVRLTNELSDQNMVEISINIGAKIIN